MNISRTRFVTPYPRFGMKKPVITVLEEEPEPKEKREVLTSDMIPTQIDDDPPEDPPLRNLDFTISKSTAMLYQPEMDPLTDFDFGCDIYEMPPTDTTATWMPDGFESLFASL